MKTLNQHANFCCNFANFIEQFNPVRPTEVPLVHQHIHMQIRFLQMEFLYGEA